MTADSIDAALVAAAARLGVASEAETATPRLDAELLLMQVLGVSRSWLYARGDRALEEAPRGRFEALVARREKGEPIAWLLGRREFFGLELAVSPHTLIPRADTETLVEQALARMTGNSGRALDLGSGSGAIALALAAHRPGWQLLGIDCVAEAVALAQHNAAALALPNACFEVGDFFTAVDPASGFELIVSNPPYIDAADEHLGRGDLRFEPRSALVAADGGMADLLTIIERAGSFLAPGGWLLLEHGHRQGEAVRTALVAAGYDETATTLDLGGRERVTAGRMARSLSTEAP
ncbi:peptide chain release factor N(5)-glutamine methyltransferase [Kushneria aurantia]|uniref:Release factor glutamine methyltransferase n=1 Tax=Kushneria aurantia TaxID=504092 RepID=A0ABV6G3X4_9GAMM|nr:peptide chain release factor N(5)-glutamine methyltransferase [Kushneria aurantia]